MTKSFFLPVMLAAALAAGPPAPAQQHKPLPMPQGKIPGAGSNHRLILKDGSYQVVRKYEIVGDRVRYISIERKGDWEEIPTDLVDWDATRRWERDHSAAADAGSDAMQEAQAIDKEEQAERDEQKARMPVVAKGLELPDEDSVFALDTFEGTPELVELPPNELALDAHTHHGLSVLNPIAASRASIELPGAHAKIHLHVNDPAIYLSLGLTDDKEQVLSHSVTVNTAGTKDATNRKHGAKSPKSGFAIVRVDQRKAVRILGSIRLGRDGAVMKDEDVIPTTVEVLPGGHWMKIVPTGPLLIGDYALVEILSSSDINQTVWDFRVDPRAGDNPGSLSPILKKND